MTHINIHNIKEIREIETLDITETKDDKETFVKHIEIQTENDGEICLSLFSNKSELLRIKKIRV